MNNTADRWAKVRDLIMSLPDTALIGLSDDTIETMELELQRLVDDFRRDGREELVDVAFVLTHHFRAERDHRNNAIENARIELEGNGHGVHIDNDGERWFAFCGCADEWYNPGLHGKVYDTEAEARAEAQRHIDETGGVWRSW